MTRSFRYRAAVADGSIVSGLLAADGQDDAARRLSQRGFFPIVVRPARNADLWVRRASRAELAVLLRGLATFAGAGVPLDRAVAACERVASARLGPVLTETRQRLREGKGLSEALSCDPIIPYGVLAMIDAGERAGRLADSLEQTALQLEGEAELVSRVRQALAYPMILALAGGASVVVIVGVVVPRVAGLIQDTGGVLPPITGLLVGLSGLAGEFWMVWLPGAVIVAGWAAYLWQQPSFRQQIERYVFLLPVIGNLKHFLGASRIAMALAGVLSAGGPLRTALDAAEVAGGSSVLAERLRRAREHVIAGMTLTASFEREHVLPGSLLPLLAIGEETGQLAEMLDRVARAAEAEARGRLAGMVRLIEPMLILCFGALVGLTAVALLQAVYSLRPGLP